MSFVFPILPLLSSSFFFLISLSFPLSFSSSSFFFFLLRSDQHSITSTTTIKTHKHHRSSSTLHQNPQAPQPSKPTSTNPHAMVAMVTMMKSPLQSTIHDHRSMIHKQRFTIKATQASFQSTHSHKFTKMLSLSLLVYLCVGVGVFDFLLILWCDRVWICLIFG